MIARPFWQHLYDYFILHKSRLLSKDDLCSIFNKKENAINIPLEILLKNNLIIQNGVRYKYMHIHNNFLESYIEKVVRELRILNKFPDKKNIKKESIIKKKINQSKFDLDELKIKYNEVMNK